MPQSVVYLLERGDDGKGRTTLNSSGRYTGGDTFIPLSVGNITVKMTRELTVLPIPVFGIAAAIDYNVRRSVITIEDIILATGSGGSSIFGRIASTGDPGWVVKRSAFGSISGGAFTNLDDKEVQRALFARAVGLTMRETALVYPTVRRILWGDQNFIGATAPDFSILRDANQPDSERGDFGRAMWANVIPSSASIKEVGGEPTKYECTLELNVIGGGDSTGPFA